MPLINLKFKHFYITTFLLTSLSFANIPAQGQQTNNAAQTMAEILPKAPYDWGQYLRNTLHYPSTAREADIQGKVYITFIVEKDGSISNVSATKGGDLGGGLPEEAIRVVKNMPKWTPAQKNGVPVRCYFTVPINFRLQNDPNPVYHSIQVDVKPLPAFNLTAFLEKNLQYPKNALKNKVTDTVFISCIITEKGTILNPGVMRLKAVDPTLKELEDEALRLVQSMPAWSPAKIKDQAVQCHIVIPIPFTLPRK